VDLYYLPVYIEHNGDESPKDSYPDVTKVILHNPRNN